MMIVQPDPVESTAVVALTGLAETFADLVHALGEGYGRSTTRHEMMHQAARCVPAGRHFALVLGEGEAHRVCAATGDPASRAVAMEVETGEGPTLDVLDFADLVVSNDLLADVRWPQFASAAFHELGIRSLLCYSIPLDRRRRAALVFLSDWPHAFDDLTIVTGRLLAQFCSLAVLTA